MVECTRKLRSGLRNPSIWIARADHLLSLGYPELTVGDAFRAREMLVIRHVSALMDGSGDGDTAEERASTEDFMKNVYQTYQLLYRALSWIGDCKGSVYVCQEGQDLYGPYDRVFKELYEQAIADDRAKSKESQSRSNGNHPYLQEYGVLWHLQYPFVSARYRKRGKQLIESTKALFNAASPNCTLSYSGVMGASRSSAQDVLGVFATKEIKFDEVLLRDTTVLAASNISYYAPSTIAAQTNPTQICENCYGDIPRGSKEALSSMCCSAFYCSTSCILSAALTYHKVMCGQDFNWLYQEAAKKPPRFALNGPLWLRILAVCIQSHCHPLEHPLIARLTPLYDDNTLRPWMLSTHIETPLRILKQLGVDIHNDLRYDTWVLQTMWARIVNNHAEHKTENGRPVRTIGPLYSFFNHSCDANAGCGSPETDYCTGGSTREIRVICWKGIRKGEEIFVNYGTQDGQSKKERNHMLGAWIGQGGTCGCPKCRREK